MSVVSCRFPNSITTTQWTCYGHISKCQDSLPCLWTCYGETGVIDFGLNPGGPGKWLLKRCMYYACVEYLAFSPELFCYASSGASGLKCDYLGTEGNGVSVSYTHLTLPTKRIV